MGRWTGEQPRNHIAAIRERRIDVAFVTGAPNLAGCDTARLWSERFFAVLHDDHPLAGRDDLTWAALRNEHFIVSQAEPGPELHDLVVQRLADHGHQPRIARFTVSNETLMHLVALGFGISLTSEAAVAARYPEVVFRALAATEDVVPYSAVWLPCNDNPALRRFLSMARSLAATRQPTETPDPGPCGAWP